MPRSINLRTMSWKSKAEHGRNEMGAGIEVADDDSIISPFLDRDDGYRAALSKLGEFEWEMADEGSDDKSKKPSSKLNQKADEIFQWAQDNLKGKWMLYECFAYRFSCAYSTYLIEDKADRDKFAKQWGDLYKYKKPTSKKPSAVLTAFEKAQEKRSAESLKEAFEASSKILPLYKGAAEDWTFAVANIDGEEKLLMLPLEPLKEITCLYGDTIDKNLVRQLGGILDGKVDFNAGGVFMDLIKDLDGFAEGHRQVAGEVNGYSFNLSTTKDGEDAEAESYADGNSLATFREAYKAGQDVTFTFGGASFTFNANKPVVDYYEAESGSTAVVDGHGGIARGQRYEYVEGQYNRATGLPEGTWKRSHGVSGGMGYSPFNGTADYKNGRLLKGTLGGDGHYQPEPPKTTVLGQKKPARARKMEA